jgi:hypothetical protein
VKKKTFSRCLSIFIGIIFVIISAQAFSKATKTDVTGYFDNVVWLQFGDVWIAGHTMHVRNRLVQWDSTATDPRMEGIIFDEFNSNQDGMTYDGRMWGKFWIEKDGERVWEGSWNGEIENSVQRGRGVGHGVGIYEGLKMKMTFEQIPAQPVIEFDAVILDPFGN